MDGALPGERVRAAVYDERAGYLRASAVEVLSAAPGRVAPPCPLVARGCGGCGWQHVAPGAQVALKVQMVTEALCRLGHLEAPEVRAGGGAGPFGYRTTVRLAVVGNEDGRGTAAFRQARSHRLVVVDDCLTAHPSLAAVLRGSHFGTATEAVLRWGARTGEGLAVLDPSAVGSHIVGDLRALGADDVRSGVPAYYHEVVAGRSLRVSAGSFFQSSPEGAEALVRAVSASLTDAPAGALVDAYSGVGMFAATLGWPGDVVAVESSPSSVSDARANLMGASVARCEVERWRPSRASAVVADPPRAGLGRKAAGVLAATGASHLALVSCDAASLGRDAGLLVALGFRLEQALVVDMFPGTPHVEVVSRFVR